MKTKVKLILVFVISILLISCKTREKTLQKTETQSEKKSEATYKIEDRTFEIVSDKELSIFDKSNFAQNNESSKTETKNIEIIKEYYENGTLKKEMQRNFSELAETTKNAITELEEKISVEKETSKYWENSSNHYYQLLEEEKSKTKDYAMQLKAKETFTWQMFFVGLILGWLLLPSLFRWVFSWVKHFQPYIALVEWIKSLLNKNIKKL